MFEDTDWAADAPWADDAPWAGDDPWAGVTVQPPAPEPPPWLLQEPAPDPDDMDVDIDAWLAALPPEERFATLYGYQPTPEEVDRFAPPTLERAAHLQDLAVQAAQVKAHADAHRIATLLTAHDASRTSPPGSGRRSGTVRVWVGKRSRPPSRYCRNPTPGP